MSRLGNAINLLILYLRTLGASAKKTSPYCCSENDSTPRADASKLVVQGILQAQHRSRINFLSNDNEVIDNDLLHVRWNLTGVSIYSYLLLSYLEGHEEHEEIIRELNA